MTRIFLDKRHLVNGRKSIINMDNSFDLTNYITDLINLLSVTRAQNGLSIQSVLHMSGIQLNAVELGSNPLIKNTIIDANTNTFGVTNATNILFNSNNLSLSGISQLSINTPDSINGVANANDVLTLMNVGLGVVEYKPIKFTMDFTVNSWNLNKITILQTTHLRGNRPMVQVYGGVSDLIQILPLGTGNPLVEIKVLSNGDIELLTTGGSEFDGYVVIS